MQRLWERHAGKAVRFGLVGLSNALIGYVGFRLFLYLLGIAFIAQAIAYAVGLFWSFWLNSCWTFGATAFSHAQFIRFIILQLCLLTASAAAIGLAVDHADVQPDLSWLVVMAAVTMVNYSLCQSWVFSGCEDS